MAHQTLVFITDARVSLNMMWTEVHDKSWSGFAIFVPAFLLVAIAWWWASPFTLRHARLVQRIGELMSRQFDDRDPVVGRGDSVYREGYLAPLLAQWHDAEAGRA